MTEILQSPLRISSSQSSLISLDDNDGLLQQTHHQFASSSSLINPCPNLYSVAVSVCNTEERERRKRREREEEDRELSLLAVVVTVFRKSLVGSCNSVKFEDFPCDNNSKKSSKMEIGVPTDVRHVAHVTFDRFNGFLGLPVEFEPEVPRRPPSARFVFLSNFCICALGTCTVLPCNSFLFLVCFACMINLGLFW